MKGEQRYKCKSCFYHFTTARRSDVSTSKERDMALSLYLEGLGFRSIGRLLDFSHVSVYHWIRTFGEHLDDDANTQKAKHIEIIELDEMHSYIGHKKTIAGFGSRLIG